MFNIGRRFAHDINSRKLRHAMKETGRQITIQRRRKCYLGHEGHAI